MPAQATHTRGAAQAALSPRSARYAAPVRWLEHRFDAVFGAAANPLKHLGALAVWLLWILLATGVVLFVVLDTSAAGAHASIAGLAGLPLGLGLILRGLHRYSADALVLVLALHIAREWALGRYSHVRRPIWLTGVPLVLLVFASAIGGFWLNWDRLGQYSAVSTAEWLDALGLFGAPLARNFLSGQALGERLFTLFLFVHIGLPLMLMFGLWFHVQRLAHADWLPPRALSLGTLAVLVLLSLALPVTSQGAADLSSLPERLRMDWLILFIHPLLDATSPAFVWLLVFALLAALLLPPLLPARPRPAVAEVQPEHCSGCERCFDDCPYSAITMVAHASGKPGARMAQVDPDLCVGCGICAGSCPSSTPFRSIHELVTGIDMPQRSIDTLRGELLQGLAALPGPGKLVVFGCVEGATLRLQARDVVQVDLICAAMLPPSFVDYAVRAGATGVLIAGCREGACAYRLGQRWSAERLAGRREPRFKRPEGALAPGVVWADAGDEAAVHARLEELRRQAAGNTACKKEFAS
ncbi:4Fe-4S binding protein [Comamonas sp. NLF-1-9]|uniref:4Fe-4S binding protein n=1 Tax=Comamonas sp. NLF-1-9 TaxID=2853163 RepID=UPI0021069605|nr:4Fe-4S binding protein [Comamonas sp. NLF-1-9]